MATSKDQPQDTPSAEASAEKPAAARTAPAQQQQALEVDDKVVHGSYANFCRVTGSPEELIIDFGLNSQPMSAQPGPIRITERIVVNYFTAKRLLHALHMSVQRHESVFGVLETDIQKRVKSQQSG